MNFELIAHHIFSIPFAFCGAVAIVGLIASIKRLIKLKQINGENK